MFSSNKMVSSYHLQLMVVHLKRYFELFLKRGSPEELKARTHLTSPAAANYICPLNGLLLVFQFPILHHEFIASAPCMGEGYCNYPSCGPIWDSWALQLHYSR